jgi:hypothetical protein
MLLSQKPKETDKKFHKIKVPVLYSIHCKNVVILRGTVRQPCTVEKNPKIFKCEYLRCLSFYRETKKWNSVLPLWTFPAIFCKIGQKKRLSALMG